jgi:hypothetical protein
VAVKGSKFIPMRVIPHSPRASLMRVGGLVLVFAVSLPASYFAGVYWAEAQHSATASTQDQAHEQVVATLTQELTQLRTGVEVDRQSMEELRQLVMTQKAQLHASERDLRVYKDLLSPGAKSNPLGISFGVFTVLPLPEPGRFNYSLTVQKLAAKEVDFSGFLEFRIIGQQGDKSLQLSLYQVSAEVSAPSIPLSFKYFHRLQGDLLLPEGFVPHSVELVVKASDQKTPPLVAAELDWPISAFKSK